MILINESNKEVLGQLLKEIGITKRSTVVTAPDYLRFTVWAEDAYAISKDLNDKQTYFVEPASFRRADDAYIADVVADATDLERTDARLYFQGGNILIGDDFWFIGMDYPLNSLKLGYIKVQPGEDTRTAVEKAYKEHLDHARKLHLIGTHLPVPSQQLVPITVNGEPWKQEIFRGNAPGTTQPLFHIDMFITLAGRDDNGVPIVLVGDPKMAADLLGETVSEFAMQEIFDDIAKNIEALGFSVIRNPLPLVYQDEASEKIRYWYFATANNALVQVEGKDKSVWLPTYGYGDWSELAVTDEENKKIWESQGFKVTMLEDFHPFAFNLGAVHCIKKYLTR